MARSEVEAERTEALVLELMAVWLLVMELPTTAASEVEAVVTSDVLAKVPEVRVASVRLRVPYVQTSEAVIPAPEVRVRVPFNHTSAASVPKVVRERVATFQTAVGIVARRDDEAVRTVALVLLLIVVIADDT